MKVITRVHSKIPKRIIRRIKFKLYKLQEKFNSIISANIYLAIEGSKNYTYSLKVVYAVPGPNVIVSMKGTSLDLMIQQCMKSSHRLLSNLTK